MCPRRYSLQMCLHTNCYHHRSARSSRPSNELVDISALFSNYFPYCRARYKYHTYEKKEKKYAENGDFQTSITIQPDLNLMLVTFLYNLA